MYKCSVIISCYNSEKYLDETINSIISQSIGFENIELILYDDGSNDSTRKIIQSYAEKFYNVVPILSDVNSGFPGAGRNKGIETSTSEYIMFLDSDDLLEQHICERLYNLSESKDLDISCCSLIEYFPPQENPIKYIVHKEVSDDSEIFLEGDELLLFECGKTHGKLFKKEIINKNNIRFPENLPFEDTLFLKECFIYSNSLIYLRDYCGYYWRITYDSFTHSIKQQHILNIFKANEILLDVVTKEKKEKYSPIIFKSLSWAYFHCFDVDCNDEELVEILHEFNKFENKLNFKLKFNEPHLNFINFFVMHKQYGIAKFLLKTIQKLKKIVVKKREKNYKKNIEAFE